jgi:hypothetical protein
VSWGGLNPALTSFRAGILARFPHRGSASDGGVADGAHSATSQHQRDADGTVDAFDCDVNWFGSSDPDGNAAEDRISEAVKRDFEDDPRAQLWIHQREIANSDIGGWRERGYGGSNPHDKHIHFETRQSRERDGRPWAMPRTDALIGWDDVTPADIEKIAKRTAEILAPGRGVRLSDVLWDKDDPPAWAAPYRALLIGPDGVEANPTVVNVLMHTLRHAGESTARQA